MSATGFGQLIVGMSAADAAAATQGSLSVPAANSAEQCDYAVWRQAPRGLFVMFEGGTLARVDVRESGIATPEGLEVGAWLARAESLYTGATHSPHKYEEGKYLVVRPLAPADTLHRLVIEVVQGRVRAFRVGRFPAVEYVEGCS